MERIEVLYDHYKETCSIVRTWEDERNKLFLKVWLLTGALFLFSVDKDSIMGMLQSWFKDSFKTDLMFSSAVIQFVIWVLLFIFYAEVLWIKH